MHLIMKRKITLFVLLSTGIILGYLSFISWAGGFLIAKYLGGRTVGERGRLRSFFIPLGKRKIHLHHWFISSWIIAFALLKGVFLISPEVFCGFLSGLVFQGIYYYTDWYKILVPRRVQSLVVTEDLEIEEFSPAATSPGTETGHEQLEMASKVD